MAWPRSPGLLTEGESSAARTAGCETTRRRTEAGSESRVLGRSADILSARRWGMCHCKVKTDRRTWDGILCQYFHAYLNIRDWRRLQAYGDLTMQEPYFPSLDGFYNQRRQEHLTHVADVLV